MKNNITEQIFIPDRSGSMKGPERDAIPLRLRGRTHEERLMPGSVPAQRAEL